MVRSLRALAALVSVFVLLWVARPAAAQVVVVSPRVYYPPRVVSYYAAPVVSYYAPPAVAYYPAPAVSYYAAPPVTYYAAPAVSYYAAPAPTYYAPARATTYYRYGVLGRRVAATTYYYGP